MIEAIKNFLWLKDKLVVIGCITLLIIGVMILTENIIDWAKNKKEGIK